MEFYFFHLMPYAALDLGFDRKWPTTTMVLPNSEFDPAQGHALYNRYLDELELADALGFDGVCVNEHHQTAYGLMPQPSLMAAALARRTSRAKIAVLGRALPLLNNPLAVAEEYAMLDCLSGGRLIAGFVRGIGAEYHISGVNPALSHARFHEAHDLILRAWTETGPFAFEGKHYRFNYVNLWPRPLQTPHPPVWIPSQGSSETILWASHPDRRYVYLQTYSPFAAVERYLGRYRETARERWGYEAADAQLGWAVPIYVGETDAKAREEAAPHIEAFFNKFLGMPQEMLLPPGYLTLESMKGVMAAKRGISAGAHTLDSLAANGMFVVGGPDEVARRLEDCRARLGLGRLICTMQFGTLPHDLVERSLTLFAREVMPRFREGARAEPAEA